MSSLDNELKKDEEIKEEFLKAIKEATRDLVSRRTLTNVDFDPKLGLKIGINKKGIGIYNKEKYRISQLTTIEAFKSIDLYALLDEIKSRADLTNNRMLITAIETIAHSLDQFEVNIIPWGCISIMGETVDYKNIYELKEIGMKYLKSINNNNENVLGKLKNDLNTLLVAKKL